jgi:cytochrome c551/c552
MKTFVTISFLFILVTTLQTACRHKPVIPDSPAIKFSQDIQPIFSSNCTMSGCHEANSRKSLSSYSDVMNYVTAGNTNKSQLYQSVTSLGGIGSKPMPPNQPLSEDQLKLIYAWIMQGAKDN